MRSNGCFDFSFAMPLCKKVAAKKNAFAAKDLTNDLGWLGANAKPIAGAVNIEHDRLGGSHRVDVSNPFN
jgi:hypothetical protein